MVWVDTKNGHEGTSGYKGASRRAWMLTPRHEGLKTCAQVFARICTQTTWWNLHYLIFDFVFWFSGPTTFEHKCLCAGTYTHGFYISTTSECKKFFFLTAGTVWVSPPPLTGGDFTRGVLVLLKFWHFSSELTKTWSSGARKYWTQKLISNLTFISFILFVYISVFYNTVPILFTK